MSNESAEHTQIALIKNDLSHLANIIEKDREDRKEDRKAQLEFNSNVAKSLSAIEKNLSKVDTLQVELNNSNHRHNAHDMQFQEQERDIKDLQKEKASSKRLTDLESKVKTMNDGYISLKSVSDDWNSMKKTVIGVVVTGVLAGGGIFAWESKTKAADSERLIKAIELLAKKDAK